MTTKQATSRFFRVFVPAMLLYITVTAGMTQLTNDGDLSARTLYALSLIPIVAIFIAFWAQLRFVLELDEFLRLIQIKGTFFGIVCVMVIASGWGQLERLADVPRIQVFWLLPIFWSAQGLATTIISKREGVF